MASEDVRDASTTHTIQPPQSHPQPSRLNEVGERQVQDASSMPASATEMQDQQRSHKRIKTEHQAEVSYDGVTENSKRQQASQHVNGTTDSANLPSRQNQDPSYLAVNSIASSMPSTPSAVFKPRKVNDISSARSPREETTSATAAAAAAAAAVVAGLETASTEGLAPPTDNARVFVPSAESLPAEDPRTVNGSGIEGNKSEVDQLQDLMGMSGVDLRAEEEAIHGRSSVTNANAGRSGAVGQRASGAQPSPFYLELYPLSHRIHKIAARNGLQVEPEVLMYLSTAAKMRFRNLLESMVAASRHRQWSSHLRPPPLYDSSDRAMYREQVYDDPQLLLHVLARVEKAEEQAARQARMQREEMEANQMADLTEDNGGPTSTPNDSGAGVGSPSVSGQPASNSTGENANQDDAKRKGKRSGVSAAARNMTEDKRLKLANKTAAQALGISAGSKAWMFGGGGGLPGGKTNESRHQSLGQTGGGASRLPKPRFAPPPSTLAGEREGGSRISSTANDDRLRQDSTAGALAFNPGGWGDLAARQRHKEEEERKRTRRVNLEDALHALEMERKGGAGRGSGERVLFATRALGRPTLPLMSSSL